jgi:SAM-dependent methyltransferase
MPDASQDYRRQRIEHWDRVARSTESHRGASGYYHRRLGEIYRQIVAPGQRVLEIGCGRGDLLAFVEPRFGVGIDFSHAALLKARSRHPRLHFLQADAHALPIDTAFDVIILSDLINDLWDVQAVLEIIRPLCTARTRIVMNFFSKLWELPLRLARKLRLAAPVLEQNWLANEDVSNLLLLAGFEPIRRWHEIIWPVRTWGIDAMMNRFVARLWPIDLLALTNVLVARARPNSQSAEASPLVSVIIPARNESGNIPAIFDRTPEMGAGTELIFVEGGSRDDTYAAIERAIAAHPNRKASLLRQAGRGKGDAVRLGFAHSTGQILMILDADLTVPPEDLPRFYRALLDHRGEMINGVRLVYPMEKRSMRFLNLLGNKFFGLAFSWLLGQPLRDTLCGTKALWRSDYETIARNRSYFGEFDPFGDFDLLFGAARLNLKILDVPIRYRERVYGETNIHRFRHGSLLLRMVVFAAGRLKFV